MSDYSPITNKDIKSMLNKLKKNSLDDLFNIISENFKFDLNDISLDVGKTEFQAENKMSVSDFVLNDFSDDEQQHLEKITHNIIDSIAILIDKKLDLFSSKVNNN